MIIQKTKPTTTEITKVKILKERPPKNSTPMISATMTTMAPRSGC